MNLQESIRKDLDKLNEGSQTTDISVMIKRLNQMFPCCEAVSTEEWNNQEGGIWFRGSESCEIDDLPLYNSEIFPETFGTNPVLEEFLKINGWYGEPYDAGTLMAYPD